GRLGVDAHEELAGESVTVLLAVENVALSPGEVPGDGVHDADSVRARQGEHEPRHLAIVPRPPSPAPNGHNPGALDSLRCQSLGLALVTPTGRRLGPIGRGTRCPVRWCTSRFLRTTPRQRVSSGEACSDGSSRPIPDPPSTT